MNKIKSFILENEFLKAEFTNLGARLTSLVLKEKALDVVLGYDTTGEYVDNYYYMNATLGRVANRIKGGKVTLGHKTYTLHQNYGADHLHGGEKGFDQVVWQAKVLKNKIIFHYLSKDLEEGYPGNLEVKVTYELFYENLHVTYEANSDQDTLCNLSNHIYFNLGGNQNPSILDHRFLIYADQYVENDGDGVASTTIASVKQTPFDFLHFKSLKRNMYFQNPQIAQSNGYDHYFIFRKDELIKAQVMCDETKVCMSLLSDYPGMQFYTGNYLRPHLGKEGVSYDAYAGFCFETSLMPNSTNIERKPSIILKKDQPYKHKVTYHFTLLD